MSGSMSRGSRAFATLLMSLALIFGTCAYALPAHASQMEGISQGISSAVAHGIVTVKSNALASESNAGDFYFAQSGSGRCTITSIAMMVRRAAFLDNSTEWAAIDEASTTADGWCGAGVKNEFSTAGYDIQIIGIQGTHEALEALLAEHPEGVAIYDPRVPHAVLLTDYDAKTDTFYCADPASHYAGKRIPLAESWNGERHGHDQASTIAGFSSAWVIV